MRGATSPPRSVNTRCGPLVVLNACVLKLCAGVSPDSCCGALCKCAETANATLVVALKLGKTEAPELAGTLSSHIGRLTALTELELAHHGKGETGLKGELVRLAPFFYFSFQSAFG